MTDPLPLPRPFLLEIIRVPMRDRSLGWVVQAECVRPQAGSYDYKGDVYHHEHTFPGTPEGHLTALGYAIDVLKRCGQSWTPCQPRWFLTGCKRDEVRLPCANAWRAWRERTGRR